MIAVAGELKAVVDDGKNAYVLSMNNPELGLYVPPMIWSMQFGHTPGAALSVIAPQQTAATTTSPIMRCSLSHAPNRLGSKAEFDFPSCSTICHFHLKFLFAWLSRPSQH
jgi:WxcM-like protein